MLLQKRTLLLKIASLEILARAQALIFDKTALNTLGTVVVSLKLNQKL